MECKLTNTDHVTSNVHKIVDVSFFRGVYDDHRGASDAEETANLAMHVESLPEYMGRQHSTGGEQGRMGRRQ